MALVIDVADAVVLELSGGTFSQTFRPERRVLPVFDLAELATLRVTVVPKAVDLSPATREAGQYDAQVDIGIQKKVGADLDAEVAALCGLVEEIADYLKNRELAALPYAKWVRTANEPVYATEHLLDKRVFTSVLTLTYRAIG